MKITATLKDTYKVDTTVDSYSYILDQTAAAGGSDEGTSPGNVLMVSVLGCKTMVAKGFLDARKLPFDKIEAEVDFEMAGSNARPKLEGIVTIKVIGATLTDKEKKQLRRIVDTGCPVANLLDSEKATIYTKIEVEV